MYTHRDSKVGFGFAGIPVFGPDGEAPVYSQALLRRRLKPGPNPWRQLCQIPTFESLWVYFINFLIFCFSFVFLSAETISTFYGPIEVEEPVLIELIHSPAFQRLKSIHQYGVSYYTTHREEYTRYEHSLGVFAILRANNCCLKEQIAGLLHDVSHTIFSHVGDWIFNKRNQEKDYQNGIHRLFLEESGLGYILEKYNLSIDEVLPEETFPALEQKLPNLCADRIDYNIQGAYYQGFITYEEALSIFRDLHFVQDNWVSTNPYLMGQLLRFSLVMTKDCWGGPRNYLISQCLADAILRGVDLGSLSYETIHFGTDQPVWDFLIHSQDPVIHSKMQMIAHIDACYHLTDPSEADLIITNKFRGIDPWIAVEGNVVRLTTLDPILSEEFKKTREEVENGWGIQFNNEINF